MHDHSFKDFVLEQLSRLPEVRAQAMFGGHGLYQDEVFFGILAEGRLYLKADRNTKPDFEAAGMGPFVYESSRGKATMSYYEIPPGVLDNSVELKQWALKAIDVALRSKRSTTVKKKKTASQKKQPTKKKISRSNLH